ncbi:phenylalanyl-tRNA synthetase subunit beta, partial [mine drainage metagenome]
MPVSTLSLERLRARLGAPLSDAALEDLLFLSKAELESRDGDDLHVSVTPDRLDLLSEAGLGLHLAGAMGTAEGRLRPPEIEGIDAARCDVDPSVATLRPAFAALTVEAPEEAGLDDGTLAEAIRFQELLHATVGRDRRVASLGIYPLDRIEFPLRYACEPMDTVRFVPLDGT